MMFDRICRKNGIKHRLIDPFSPNQNGKVERFHGTLRPDFLDQMAPFTSLAAAQTAVDAWVADYNIDRPHQALDDKQPVTPADRFRPVADEQRQLIELWLPPTLVPAPPAESASMTSPVDEAAAASDPWLGGPVELDQVVPSSGNMWLAGRQFWLGPARAGLTVRFWASTEVIHLSIAGGRVKSVASHLTVADLRKLAVGGARNAGPPPIPTLTDGEAIDVDRVISSGRHVHPRRADPGRCGDPGRTAGRHPGRADHAAAVRPGNQNPAPHPAEPARRRAGTAAPRVATSRATAPASARASPGATPRRPHRRCVGVWPTRRRRPRPRPTDPHRGGLRHHPGHRARRRRCPRRPPDHHQPRHYDQGQIAADGHHRNLDHLSQINWRENVAHQVSLDKCRLADGRFAWHDRPAGLAEVDAGRYRNGHDCGVPAGVAFPCTPLSGRRYCRGTKDLVYRGYGLRRPRLVVQGRRS